MEAGGLSQRRALLEALCERILGLSSEQPLRIAVDGVDCAGKTTLADELAPLLESRGRPVLRASIDGFHRPHAERTARGDDSPEGYYCDSFDHGALRRVLLEPLGPGGDRRYRTAVFDSRSDSAQAGRRGAAPENAILLLDGVFLLRPELNDCWDFRIYVDCSFDETLRRALIRDRGLFGSTEQVRRRYRRRYIPGQRLYLDAVEPRRLADVVVDNEDPRNARIVVPLTPRPASSRGARSSR